MTVGPTKQRSRDDSDDDSSIPTPPDGGWGWIVVFSSFMIHIIADGVTYTFGIFFVEFLHYYKEGKGATSWIASILVGITLGTGPIASALTNKYGCRLVTIIGSVLAAVGFFVSIYAQNVATLCLTIGVLAGLGFGLIYLPAIVSVTCYFEKRRAFATGIAVCGSGLGTFIFAPLIEILVETYSWKGAMMLVSGIVLNCTVFGALFRPLEPTVRKRRCSEVPSSTVEMKQLINGVPSNPEQQFLLPSKTDIVQPQIQKLLSSNGQAVTAPDGLRLSASAHNLMHSPQNALLKTQVSHRSVILGSNRSLMTKPPVKEEEPHSMSAGPMYRKDIFYSGSLLNLPQYRRVLSWPFYPALSWAGAEEYANRLSIERSNPQMYTMSVTHIPKETETSYRSSSLFSCCRLSRETKDTLKEMMDVSIFKDPIFVLFAISNFCTSIGFNVPYVYIKDRALLLKISGEDSSFLLAIIGIANTISRVVLGYISDKTWLNRLYLYNSSLTICGLGTMFSAFCLDYTSLAFYAAVFGATAGAYVGLTSVILVDLLGLEKLTNAFGLLLLFQGVASLLGPPIAGWLYDSLGSYDPGFYVAGAMIAISGAMLFAIPAIQWCQKKQPSHANNIPNVTVSTNEEIISLQSSQQVSI